MENNKIENTDTEQTVATAVTDISQTEKSSTEDKQTDITTNRESSDNSAEKNENTVLKEIFSWIRIFIVAFLLAAVIDNLIIINANVPSGSMQNTIMTGDRMIGNRLAYLNSSPKRGDVIIFKFPDNEEEDFVKRVIGLPGETVTIRDAKIYINDNSTPLEEDYLPEQWVIQNDGFVYEVPADSYFVLGDNRNSSNDARYWKNTFVKKDAIIAKAVYVYWPFSNAGVIHSAEYSIDE